MTNTFIENIQFNTNATNFKYDCSVTHQQTRIGILKASLYTTYDRFVELNKIQTHFDYRHKSVARIMLSDLVTWAREKQAISITGSILPEALLKDSPENFALFLQKLGFTVQNYDFWMNL